MKYVILLIVIVVIFSVIALLYPWISIWFGLSLIPTPPKPSVEMAEFHFELKYELNNEIIIISDKAICNFDGYNEKNESGQSRKWEFSTSESISIKDDDEKDSLLVKLKDLSAENEYDKFGRKILELYFYGGNGYHYMSDFLGDHNRDEQEFDYVSYRYRTAEGDVGHSSIPADEAYEKYKIRLIYWEASPPIENSFK